MKTVLGKNNYLFLKSSIDIHTNANRNIDVSKYDKYKDKMIFIIFPDKEVICQEYLPENKDINRLAADVYNTYFTSIIDGINLVDNSDYYKTDTHMNYKGVIKIHKEFLLLIENKFSVQIPFDYDLIKTEVPSLMELNIGLGDLTWVRNKGNVILDNINDDFYHIPDRIYLSEYKGNDSDYLILDRKLNDVSKDYLNKIISWDDIKEICLYKNNKDFIIDKKVLLFYDSFLIMSLNLYKNIFKEIFLIKDKFSEYYVNKINPDIIIEFRVERFL